MAGKNQKGFMADLRLVYKAEIALNELEENWGAKYPIILKSWRKKWPNLSVYFEGRLDDVLDI